MYERLLITFGLMAFLGVVFMLLKRRQIAKANRASQQLSQQTNMPTIVYFWSNGCAVCKGQQKPIIEGIVAEYGESQVKLTMYNIDEAPEVAVEWGVMTLPTTFLLDATGTIKHVNNGLIYSDNLRKQLEPMIS